MKLLKALRILVAVLTGIGLAGLAAGFFATSSMIVALGVRALATLQLAALTVCGIGAVTLLGGTVPAVALSLKKQNTSRLLEHDREQDRRRFSDYAHDSLNPDKTRVRFEQLRAHNPKLSGLIDRCVEQMDRIDAYQARQDARVSGAFADVKPKFFDAVYDLVDRSEGAIPLEEQLAAIRERFEEYFIAPRQEARLPRFGAPQISLK